MRKIIVILLSVLLSLSFFAGCTKKDPDPTPTVTPTAITVNDVKNLIKGKDEIADGLNGTYSIVSSNTQNDKNELVVKYTGENDEYSYEAEYTIKSTFKDGAWVMDDFTTNSSKKTEKTITPEPDPTPTPDPQPSSSDITLTKEEIIEKIKQYLIKKDDLDTVSCDSITIDKTSGTAKMTGKVRWRYINDTNKYTVTFTGSGKDITITKATMTSQKTYCNLDDYSGVYEITVENTYHAEISVSFKPNWQFRIFYTDGSMSGDILEGTYSINNDVITLAKGVQKYLAGTQFKLKKVKLSNGKDGYELILVKDMSPFSKGDVLSYKE